MQPSSTNAATIDNKRREIRHLVFKRAAIIKGTSNCEIRCTVRNQNTRGAGLYVSPEARVPEKFLLYVPIDGVAYRAVLKWRRNGNVGVAFHGSEPKPPLHYG